MEKRGQVRAGVPWSEGMKDSTSSQVARVKNVSVSLSLPFAVQCTAQHDVQLLSCAKQPAPPCFLGGLSSWMFFKWLPHVVSTGKTAP